MVPRYSATGIHSFTWRTKNWVDMLEPAFEGKQRSVPCGGHTSQFLSSLSPKRVCLCGTKKGQMGYPKTACLFLSLFRRLKWSQRKTGNQDEKKGGLGANCGGKYKYVRVLVLIELSSSSFSCCTRFRHTMPLQGRARRTR